MGPLGSDSDVGFAELVQRDRALFEEVCARQAALFEVAVKVLDAEGNRLVDIPAETSLCQYVYGIPACRQACRRIVSQVRREVPGFRAITSHRCFSGAEYRVAPIHNEVEVVGKLVVGPFVPDTLAEPPVAFVEMAPEVDPTAAWSATQRFTALAPERADALATTLATVVEVMCFISRKSELTTDLHVESIREAYTELSEKHARLESTTQELTRLDRRSAAVVSNIGRSLGTPLTNIIAHAEMLSEGAFGDPGDDQRAFLETIIDEGEVLLDLADTLQELSRIQRGLVSLRPSPTDVTELVEGLADEVSRAAAAREVSVVVVDEGGDLPLLWLDIERLRAALRHVLDNAVENTPAGGRVRLSASLAPRASPEGVTSERLRIRVSDDGVGIDPDDQKRLFEPFYTVDRGHVVAGVGLGLTLANAYVRAHGGEIRIDSTPGEGSTFSLELPVAGEPGRV